MSIDPRDLGEADKAIQAQLDLLRHSSSVEGKTLQLLETLKKQLQSKLSGKMTEWGRARTNAMLKEASQIIDRIYSKIAEELVGSVRGVAEMMANQNKLSIANLSVTMSKIDARLGYKLVNVDIQALEKMWSKSDFYVGPDGAGGIGKRYENVMKYILDNSSFEASSVYIKPDGVVGFENGRHRYAAIRDAGNTTIPVAMDPESVQNAKKYGYLAEDSSTPQRIEIELALSAPSESVIASLVKNSLIEGAPSSAWWAKQSADTSFKFSNIVRQGIAQGDTNEVIFRRVNDILALAGRNSRALVQTSIMQAASDARMALIEANTDIYSGYRQLSTLDGHTTPQCIARSGLVWNLDREPVGHDLPFKQTPLHWGCRSVMMGVLKSFKELGIDLKEPKGLTRSSSEGQIDRNTSFESFLSRRSQAQQDDQLGSGRAQMWRDGKITLRDLVDNHGNPLTLEQLRSRYE